MRMSEKYVFKYWKLKLIQGDYNTPYCYDNVTLVCSQNQLIKVDHIK